MSPRTFKLLAVLAAVVCLAGGLAGGWFLRGPSSSSNSNGTTPPASGSTLTLVGAGSLNAVLPALAANFASQTPGVSAPNASQTYEGSIVAMHAISQLHQAYDVALAADYRLIPQILETSYASYEVMFASDPVVLAYAPSVAALAGINGSNWATKIESSGILLGISNASTDPLGYAAIFALELDGLLQSGDLTSVYGHFFTGAPGALAKPVSSATRLAPEMQAGTELTAGTVQAFLVYQSYAKSAHLTFLSLPWQVYLGSLNATALSTYAQASTAIVGSYQSVVVVKGTPVLFGATVPLNAPNAALGELFLAYLLSPATAPALTAAGFVPLPVAWTDRPSSLPNALAANVQALPAPLAAAIT
ncbi:MAG: substrate-binding domain-containing protein [Thermoplasmata archaeon]|nr:substrate-binding domain-containing protein [Thermoplasmata archaeon]